MIGSEPELVDAPMRIDQIAQIYEVDFDSMPIMIHGSLAHTVVRGEPLPTEVKFNGQARDIDVFTHGISGKLAVESALGELGITNPNPVDAGLCGLLVSDNQEVVAVQKDGLVVELNDDEGLFTESRDYEIPGTDGRTLRSFTPEGMLAIHSLEPWKRVSHPVADRKFIMWCKKNGVTLPEPLQDSIDEFHRAYNAKFPHAQLLRNASDIYVNAVPERIRKQFRTTTHRIMQKYAGRENPYA